MIDKAIMFAAKAHKGMYRKGNKQPYIFHPIEVLSLTSLMSDDEDVLCGALLHDTVEDTPVSIEDIKKEFNDRVAQLVSYESEDKRGNVNKAATWKDRKQETINRIKDLDDIGAKMICLADKVANLRSFNQLYLAQGDKMWDNFNNNNPLDHYWYYSQLANSLDELKNSVVYKEYLFLIDAIFKRYL